MELSPANYRDLKTAARSFESTGSYVSHDVTMTIAGEPLRLSGTSVSADLFPTLGVAPLLGRTFSSEDDQPGAPGTVILSYGFWQSRFAGDQNVLGRIVTFDNAPYTVIGVMPREVRFPSRESLFWTSHRFPPRVLQDGARNDNFLESVGRLKPGVSIAQARAEVGGLAERLERQHPKQNRDTGAALFSLGEEISQSSRVLLLALSGAAACVLLIACANLANLLLARALGRRRELAVRTALGAGRERLVRQLMTESLLLAGVGGAIGVGVAAISVPLFVQLVPATLPIASSPAVDLRVLVFAIALIAVTGLAFGLVPVLRASGETDLDGLREGARSGGGQKDRLRSALVVAEVAASVALLVSAGLLIRALLTVRAIDPGFRADGVMTLRTELPMPEYGTVAAREAFYARVRQQIHALPGVSSAGFVSFLPMSSFRGGIWPVSVKGDVAAGSETRGANNVASIRYVTPGYFEALAIPLKRGRDISEADNRDRQAVAVVSESFVRRYWPNQDPISRHFTFAFADREVVGVAGDVRFRGLERVSEPQVYLPSAQVNDGAILFYVPKALAIRTTGSPESLVPAVREIIRRAEPKLPIFEVQTLEAMVAGETATRAMQVRVLVVFTAIAFGLAAVGIHGLLSFAVSQRVTEIGVRRALGAQSRDVLVMVAGRGLALAAAGAVPGVLIAYAAGRAMEALLAGVGPADVRTFVAATALCVLMTVLGTLAPTLRALRVDPVTALRAE
jgi:predicted permease